MITKAINRPFIDRLKSDPRFFAMVQGWEYQAVMETEAQFSYRRCDREVMHQTAAAALKLALEFILQNDGEYRAVCEQRDAILKHSLDAMALMPGAVRYMPEKVEMPGQGPMPVSGYTGKA